MNIGKFESLLAEFKQIYNPNETKYEPSYLEICDYPGSRKEEICSRLLAFFFDSHNPHGMGTLFYDTLLEVYKEKTDRDLSKILYQNNVTAQTEIYTSIDDANRLKRIDLLLESDCSIICIENKIWAELKNNLDVYYKYTESVKGEHRESVYIILSMREDMEKMLIDSKCENKEKYKVIYYREFLKQLKKNLGDYVTLCNTKYFSVLTDFIQFLDQEGGPFMNFDDDEKKFYIDNSEIIKKMINRRNEFLKYRVTNLIDRLNENCYDESLGKWWLCNDNLGVGIHFMKGSRSFEIGIESRFEDEGLFTIYITIWIWKEAPDEAEKRRNLYNEKIKEKFSTTFEKIHRKYLALIAKEKFESEEIAFKKLLNVYNNLCDIVHQVTEEK